MKQLNNMTYVLWRQGLLQKVQMLVIRLPETGINPDKVYCFSDDELTGAYEYLKNLSENIVIK